MVWHIQFSWTHVSVPPLFVAQTTLFGILDFHNAEGQLVRHGAEDHEIRDGSGV